MLKAVCDKCTCAMRCDCRCHTTDSPPDKRGPLSQRFHQLLMDAGNLHDKKQKDYGREEDPFANVRASEDFGVPPWIGAMTRANDKMRRLQKFAVDGVLVNEAVEDSFMDLAVYVLIARVLWEEESKNEKI